MNQQNQVSDAPVPKANYFLMGVLACALAYIVTKDVQIESFWIIGGILTASVFLLVRGLVQPEIVTYALVAYLPFSKELAGDFGGFATAFNLTNLFMVFIIFVWMSGRFAADEPLWLKTPLNVPIMLFLLLGFISVVRGSYYDSEFWIYSLTEFKRWMTPVFMYFLVLNTVKDRRTIKDLVIIMSIVITIVGLMAIYEYINIGEGSSLDRSRIGGIADQPNMLAAFFNYYMFLPFGFFLLNMRRWKYWLLWAPFLICFRGIMVTFSRGGYVAFALGLYAISFFRSKVLFTLMLFLGVLVYLNPALLPAGIQYRMGQTFHKNVSYADSVEDVENSLDASARSRVEVWKGGLQMVKDNPFFGVGYGLFEECISHYWSEERPIDAHNTYLIIAAEMGIPTLLVFLAIILLTIWNTYGLYHSTPDTFAKATALGFLGGLFGLLMSNMFGSRLDSQEVSSYFWILAALVMRLRILDEKERENEIVSAGLGEARLLRHRGAPSRNDEDRHYEAANQTGRSNLKAGSADKNKKLDACWGDA